MSSSASYSYSNSITFKACDHLHGRIKSHPYNIKRNANFFLCYKKHIRNRNYPIFYSLSAIHDINNYNHKFHLFTDIRSTIHEISIKHKTIDFCWMPSHTGIIGNEKADEAAKAESEANNVDNCPLPYMDFYQVYE